MQPTHPLPKKRMITVLASVVIGIMIGMGVALIIEFYTRKLENLQIWKKFLEYKC